MKYNPDQLVSDFIKIFVTKGILPDVKSILHGSEPIIMPMIKETMQNLDKKLSEVGLKAGDNLMVHSKNKEKIIIFLVK